MGSGREVCVSTATSSSTPRLPPLFALQHPTGIGSAGDRSPNGDRALADLLELAAVITLIKGGTVYVLPQVRTREVGVLLGLPLLGAAATTAALELLGDRVGRLTLVAITDLDDSTAGREERACLQGELERQAGAVRAWLGERDGPVQAQQAVVPELQLMAGPPARTLDTIAAEDGYGLLVVGARGAGMSSVLLGSVATSLAAWQLAASTDRTCR